MFKKNDVICIVGSTRDKAGTIYEFGIGTVIEVALNDLIVQPETGFWNSHIRVSKRSCIRLDPLTTSPEIYREPPEIGDLVMSYTHNYRSEPVKEIGILIAIKHTPGKLPSGKVMVQGDQKSYDLNSLIIIEKNSQRKV
ncbi:MAG: hypothetical protein CBC29_06820 [Methylococcaceae bacterium TMED69]|nr:MAG: hypothetical protein CBC29_06820 [Methylococcaceae bacterium TMED69]|tara:strand:+ start:596 stop:1012 length:417 start_codon:yes stop_codon:yes gene_type:complete